MIRLVIDSTCDMPGSIIEKYNIAVLPLFVEIEGKCCRDGVEITNTELYKAMRQGILPKTSQISTADAVTLFKSIADAGDDMIYLSFSSEMSGTYHLAKNIIATIEKQYPERKLTAVDSEGGCSASGLIAMQAARWIAVGRKSYEEVLALMKEMIAHIQHLFTLDSLNWLARGGRIDKPVGYLGDMLQIKPILHVKNKTMHVFQLVHGRKKVLKTLVDILKERTCGFEEQLIAITHTDDLESAKKTEQMVHDVLPKAKTIILPIGCVLATHLGIGGVGIFFLNALVTGYDLLEENI